MPARSADLRGTGSAARGARGHRPSRRMLGPGADAVRGSVKFGIELPQHLGFGHLRAMAAAAEDLGYDSLWVRDHLIVDHHEMASFQQGFLVNGQRHVSGSYLACLPA